MAKLLIVDDEKIMFELGKPYFERKGNQVLYAKGGKEGLDIFKNEKPDVVLLDLGLPDIDGKDVLVCMRKADERVKIIVLTGFSDKETKEAILPLGADAYFTKPCRFPLVDMQIKKWFSS